MLPTVEGVSHAGHFSFLGLNDSLWHPVIICGSIYDVLPWFELREYCFPLLLCPNILVIDKGELCR